MSFHGALLRSASVQRRRITLATLVAALLVLHMAQWRPGVEPMLLGFLPWDLGYHLLWMVAATSVVIYMTDAVWPRE